jgi:hypothetical protein
VFALVAASLPVRGQELSGDTRLACEAILCLSTGAPPSECGPALARYFGISLKRWTDTVRGRINFLNLCPVSSGGVDAANLGAMIDAIGNGAGLCSAATLNESLLYSVPYRACRSGNYYEPYSAAVLDDDTCSRETRWVVSDRLPQWCASYVSHPYTRLGLRYVGTPLEDGKWIDGSQ